MSLLPKCREVAAALAEGGFEDAGPLRRALLRLHLWHCGACAAFERQLALLGSAFRRAAARGPDPARLSALQGRLLSRLG